MDNFDKKIKDAFEQPNDVPSDFNWENMEQGILNKMGNQSVNGGQKFKPSMKSRTILSSILLLMIVGIIYYFNTTEPNLINDTNADKKLYNKATHSKTLKENNKNTTDLQVSLITDEEIDQKFISNPILSVKNNSSNNSNAVNSVSSESTKKLSSHTQKNKNQSSNTEKDKLDEQLADTTIRHSFTEQVENFNHRFASDHNILKSNISSQTNHKNIINNVTTKDAVYSVKSQVKESSNIAFPGRIKNKNNMEIKNNKVLERINILRLPLFELNNKKYVISNKPAIETITSNENLIFGMEILTGLNTFNGKYDVGFMNEYTSIQAGYFGAVNGVLSHKSWSFSIGYQYEYLNELFSYENVTQTPVTFENIVVKENINSFTDESTLTYGDTTLLRDRTRKIVKYNIFISHSINIGATKNFLLNEKLTTGIGMGIGYNFITSMKGISFDQDEEYTLYDIGGTSSFSVNAQLNLNYKLSTTTSLVTRLSFRKQLNDINNIHFKMSSPNIINAGVGLRYTL